MDKAIRLILKISYGLGLVALVGGLVLRLSDQLAVSLFVSPRGALLFAVCLFLCAIASYTMLKTEAK